MQGTTSWDYKEVPNITPNNTPYLIYCWGAPEWVIRGWSYPCLSVDPKCPLRKEKLQ